MLRVFDFLYHYVVIWRFKSAQILAYFLYIFRETLKRRYIWSQSNRVTEVSFKRWETSQENPFLNFHCDTLWSRFCAILILWFCLFMNFRTAVTNHCIMLHNHERVVKVICLLVSLFGYLQMWKTHEYLLVFDLKSKVQRKRGR